MKAIAKVRILVEVPVGNYDMTATMANIALQAKNEAISLIRNRMAADGLRMIGDPQILCVIAIEESEK